jgi:hypothetical protein
MAAIAHWLFTSPEWSARAQPDGALLNIHNVKELRWAFRRPLQPTLYITRCADGSRVAPKLSLRNQSEYLVLNFRKTVDKMHAVVVWNAVTRPAQAQPSYRKPTDKRASQSDD